MLNVHRDHKACYGWRGGEGGTEVGGEEDYIYLLLHVNVSLTVRDKVTRLCPQTTMFEEKGEPKWI